LIRGSKNAVNYLTDIDLRLTKPYEDACPTCGVEEGFFDAWRSVSDEVQSSLKELKCQFRNLQIVGHSLGAAMAAVAAFELSGNYSISRHYGYGQPRVGNARFAKELERRLEGTSYYRVVDYKDLVPRLPLRDMFFEGFVHAGPEVYYNATELGAYTICHDPLDKRCSTQWPFPFDDPSNGCFHCSYLGMNPCHCGSREPDCRSPSDPAPFMI